MKQKRHIKEISERKGNGANHNYTHKIHKAQETHYAL
jgi:hypothetical protein